MSAGGRPTSAQRTTSVDRISAAGPADDTRLCKSEPSAACGENCGVRRARRTAPVNDDVHSHGEHGCADDIHDAQIDWTRRHFIMLATDGTHVACSTDESLYMWQARDVASLVRDTAWRVRAEERYDEEECVRARVRGMVRAQKRQEQRKRVSKRRRRDRARSSRTQRKRRRLAGRASRLLRSRDIDSSEQDLAKPRRGTPQERRARRRARKRASARVRRDDGSANSRGNGATSAVRSSTGAVTNDCNMLEAATDMEYCEERDDDSLTEEHGWFPDSRRGTDPHLSARQHTDGGKPRCTRRTR